MRIAAKGKFKTGAGVLGLAALLMVPALVPADSASETNGDYYLKPAFECPADSSNDTLTFTHPIDARIIRVCSSGYETDSIEPGSTEVHFCEDIAKDQKETKGRHHGVAFLVIVQVCVQGQLTNSNSYGYEVSASLDGVPIPKYGSTRSYGNSYNTRVEAYGIWTAPDSGLKGGKLHLEVKSPQEYPQGVIADDLVIK